MNFLRKILQMIIVRLLDLTAYFFTYSYKLVAIIKFHLFKAS